MILSKMPTPRIILAIYFLCSTVLAFSLDVTVEASPTLEEIGKLKIPFLLELSGNFGNKMNFDIKHDWDTVWRNTFGGGFGVSLGHIDVGIGFFLGLGDMKLKTSDLGIKGSAGVHFTEQWLLNVTVGTSTGNIKDAEGSSKRLFFEATYGFWIPHIYTIIYYSYSDYTEQVSSSQQEQTTRCYYGMTPTFFSKNIPFRISFDIRNEDQAGSFYLNLFVGAGIDLIFSKSWMLYTKIDTKMVGFLTFDEYRLTVGITLSYPERDY